MNKVYVTGDCHGDFNKFSFKNFYEGKLLDKNDFVFIAGDFGGVWKSKETNEEKYWLDWLNDRPWTTLIVLGNHENYEAIANNYPIEEIVIGDKDKGEYFKGRKIRDSVIIIERGEYFYINNKSYFCFGGAESHDKEWRVEGISWWKEEVATPLEMNKAIDQLSIEGNEVDIIITHEAPLNVCCILYNDYNSRSRNIMSMFLNEIYNSVAFTHWYCGHHHMDKEFLGNTNIVFRDIKRIF